MLSASNKDAAAAASKLINYIVSQVAINETLQSQTIIKLYFYLYCNSKTLHRLN